MSKLNYLKKQVAYNQIKRQVDEIKRLNISVQECVDKDLDTKNQLLEYRYQLDDKEAKVILKRLK